MQTGQLRPDTNLQDDDQLEPEPHVEDFRALRRNIIDWKGEASIDRPASTQRSTTSSRSLGSMQSDITVHRSTEPAACLELAVQMRHQQKLQQGAAGRAGVCPAQLAGWMQFQCMRVASKL